MMEKLNLQLKEDSASRHSFFLMMEEITLTTCKNAIEWVFEANFSEERPDMLNLIICSPGGDLNAAFAMVDTMRGSAIPIRTIGLGQIASAGLISKSLFIFVFIIIFNYICVVYFYNNGFADAINKLIEVI